MDKSNPLKGEIVIDENFTLVSDRNNWMLRYESEPHETTLRGKDIVTSSKETTYYPNMIMALKAYSDKSLKGSNSLQEIVDRQFEILKRIENLC
jgi:hypothetical protein